MWKVLIPWYFILFHKQKGPGYLFTFMYRYLEMSQGKEQNFVKQEKIKLKPNVRLSGCVKRTG